MANNGEQSSTFKVPNYVVMMDQCKCNKRKTLLGIKSTIRYKIYKIVQETVNSF